MAGEGKFVATALFVPLPTRWITWAMQRALELGCWGSKLLLGMGWRPRSLRADFKSQFGICECLLVPTRILKPLKSCPPQLTETFLFSFWLQGTFLTRILMIRSWLVSAWAVRLFSRRVALASPAVCSSAPLSCKVCVQSGSWPVQTNVESSSKRLWPFCVQILSSLWVRQIFLNYNSFGQAEQPSGIRWRRQGTSLGCVSFVQSPRKMDMHDYPIFFPI